MKKIFHPHGFHLIEILITLAIIGILLTLSFPLFNDYFICTKRLEAANMLSQLAVKMEQYHIENNTYQNVSLAKLHFPKMVAKNNYQLIIQATSFDYLLIAKPLGKQAEKDRICKSLTLNSYGEKNITGPGKVVECW